MAKSSASIWTETGRLLIPTAIALALIWGILSKTLATFLISNDPTWALAIAPQNAEAMIRLADRALGQDLEAQRTGTSGVPHQDVAARAALVKRIVSSGIPSPMLPPDIADAERMAARAWASDAWLQEPFDPRAPRLLAQLAETDDATRRLMLVSHRLSLHEPLTNYWLVQDAFLREDDPATLAFADILLRNQPSTSQLVSPILMRIAESRHDALLLERYLRADPPWRRNFFEDMPASAIEPTTPFNLLMDLKANGVAPTRDEIRFCIAYLIERRLYGLAREARGVLVDDTERAGMKLLLDGNFATEPTGMPFDWRFQFSGGVRISIAQPPGMSESKAVKLEFLEQFIPAFDVQQMIVLPAGTYELSGKTSGIYNARHGLHWTVSCVDQPYIPISQSNRLFGTSSDWKDFSYAFTVPAENCPAQYLSLTIDAVSDSERIVSGTAWFTGLQLVKRP